MVFSAGRFLSRCVTKKSRPLTATKTAEGLFQVTFPTVKTRVLLLKTTQIEESRSLRVGWRAL